MKLAIFPSEELVKRKLLILKRLVFISRYQFYRACSPFMNSVYRNTILYQSAFAFALGYFLNNFYCRSAIESALFIICRGGKMR